jgi:hypothetical protein
MICFSLLYLKQLIIYVNLVLTPKRDKIELRAISEYPEARITGAGDNRELLHIDPSMMRIPNKSNT